MKLKVIATSGHEFNWEVNKETAKNVMNIFTEGLADKVAFRAMDDNGQALVRCVNFDNVVCMFLDM